MKKGEIRDTQLASLIAEELEYVLCSANDMRLAELRVTGVFPKTGGRHFTIYLAPNHEAFSSGSNNDIKSLLNKASGFLRFELASQLNLKRMPELTFMLDPLYSLS